LKIIVVTMGLDWLPGFPPDGAIAISMSRHAFCLSTVFSSSFGTTPSLRDMARVGKATTIGFYPLIIGFRRF